MDLSHLDWPSILVTAAFASLGAVAGMAIKQWFDRSLEEKKVRWGRASWVHQKQVDALMKLYRNLYDMQGAFQEVTAEYGEQPEQKYLKFAESTWLMFIENKLIFPQDVVEKCNEIFTEHLRARVALMNADSARVGGDVPGMNLRRKEAREKAFMLIPGLLNEIENAAREIIDSETKIGGWW